MYNKSYPKISGIYIMQENMKLILDLKNETLFDLSISKKCNPF